MSAFIKRHEPKKGGAVVQGVFKHGRAVKRTVNIGTAHSEECLGALVALADGTIHEGQMALGFPEYGANDPSMAVETTHSRRLWGAMASVYAKLGFDALKDDTFKQLAPTRIIKSATKANTKTTASVLRAFSERHGLEDVCVAVGAAMLSGQSLTGLITWFPG